jgi:hypothetical protein
MYAQPLLMVTHEDDRFLLVRLDSGAVVGVDR